MDASLRSLVWDRSGGRCEYCRLSQQVDVLPFQVDHIVASKHRGATAEDNLCVCCYACNAYKGPNIAGIDPDGGELTRLFNPRLDRWDEHFAWNGPVLIGRSAIGRTTIDVLRINLPERIEHRHTLIDAGQFESADGSA